jgi:hypothetical protein
MPDTLPDRPRLHLDGLSRGRVPAGWLRQLVHPVRRRD